ncbi:hypothetical protein HRI_001734400 [Hibiscus trionum]|uniref:Uncharacterized protein n=1 Tax=Hibiscus trionum TaxID=183268 RepID=A0A9W7HP67_HIBTR|nr:hypothetical protein HRI_001734400 [Hibiscus trionum]
MSRSAQGLGLYHSSFQERDLSNVIRSRTALKFNVDGASEDYCAYTGVGGILCDKSVESSALLPLISELEMIGARVTFPLRPMLLLALVGIVVPSRLSLAMVFDLPLISIH